MTQALLANSWLVRPIRIAEVHPYASAKARPEAS